VRARSQRSSLAAETEVRSFYPCVLCVFVHLFVCKSVHVCVRIRARECGLTGVCLCVCVRARALFYSACTCILTHTHTHLLT